MNEAEIHKDRKEIQKLLDSIENIRDKMRYSSAPDEISATGQEHNCDHLQAVLLLKDDLATNLCGLILQLEKIVDKLT